MGGCEAGGRRAAYLQVCVVGLQEQRLPALRAGTTVAKGVGSEVAGVREHAQGSRRSGVARRSRRQHRKLSPSPAWVSSRSMNVGSHCWCWERLAISMSSRQSRCLYSGRPISMARAQLWISRACSAANYGSDGRKAAAGSGPLSWAEHRAGRALPSSGSCTLPHSARSPAR